ncbi:WW domain-binding protein 4-like [Dreissena polymorpha]|nr:WW domain-binding protein 4-like [Dreissena polymorpha]
MSEYWKSQPRKFCAFCKCWITDNKPSVDFHEKGKRHQENVKLKIEEAKKKGVEAEKKKQKDNAYLNKMEKAAMEAFKRDLEDNPELAKQYNVKVPLVEEGPQLPEGFIPKPEPLEGSEEKGDSGAEGEWYEALSDMGYPYYWNTVTGASIWVAPENYVSLADQGLAPPRKDKSTNESSELTQEPSKPEEIPLPPGPESIPLPGECPSQPEFPAPDESEDSGDEAQDRNARGVYGTWARVQKQQVIDLQLPQIKEVECLQIPVPNEEKVKFKEKRVTSLGPSKGGPVAFKKRKLGEGAKNVRKRNDDD